MAIQTDITTQYEDTMNEIKSQFEEVRRDTEGGKGVDKIRILVEEARYLEKMLDEIGVKEDMLKN